MYKLKLTSSSSLLPKNRNWNKLKNELNLKFSDYGDWHDEIVNDKSNILSITFFLEDFVNF